MEKLIGGFDIGGTKSAVILAEEENGAVTLIGRRELPTKGEPATVIEALIQLMRAVLRENGRTVEDLTLIGVCCGGPLDEENGVICAPVNLPDWDNIPITEILSERFGCPAHLMNDANACALAEYRFGAGVGKQHMIYLTFGTGLGAGLVIGGKLYHGASNNAGEAGHVRLRQEGPFGHGKLGSFEGFCSGGGIARLAADYFKDKKGIAPTAKELFQMAEAGDPDALSIFSLVGERFGEGLAILIDILNPELIVVGGVFMRAEKYIRASMENALAREAIPSSLAAVRIVPAKLSEEIGDYAAIVAAGV